MQDKLCPKCDKVCTVSFEGAKNGDGGEYVYRCPEHGIVAHRHPDYSEIIDWGDR